MQTYINYLKKAWNTPEGMLTIDTIDLHTGGEPLRVVISGWPEIPGKTVLDRRRYVMENHDHLRKALMWEPRGHADMYGCIIIPPNDEMGDFGIIFMHNEGYSTNCGHAIIAISALAFMMEWKEGKEGENKLIIDAPCGRMISYTLIENRKVKKVRFESVPSFAVTLNTKIKVPGLGNVTYDLAYGGAFYAYVDMDKNDFDFDLSSEHYQTLIHAGMHIKQAVMTQSQHIHHPFEEDLSFLYGTIFLSTDLDTMTSRNVCIFAAGEVDRCPTGSGVSGRMAIHYERQEMRIGDVLEVESIVGSKFLGSIKEVTNFGPYAAVIPMVEGNAHITGKHTFLIDPNDPLKTGFIFR